ncbi:MAG: hypothetical protein HZB36_01695 [Candidatus Omnitrophica bacterium]|nr:hypothetical protein [Candidatus Omnitrophota bacterium]
MKISILDAQQTIFQGAVSEANLPASGGELTIMDDHEPIFVLLARGYIRLTAIAGRVGPQSGKKEDEIKPIFISRGLARMRNNELIILVE